MFYYILVPSCKLFIAESIYTSLDLCAFKVYKFILLTVERCIELKPVARNYPETLSDLLKLTCRVRSPEVSDTSGFLPTHSISFKG